MRTLPPAEPLPAPVGYTSTASLTLTVSLPPVPIFDNYVLTYGTTVPYNTGSATAASIDVATLGAPSGSPTAWYLGETGTSTTGTSANGGTASVTTAGVVSYTPPAGFYGADSVLVRAHNLGRRLRRRARLRHRRQPELHRLRNHSDRDGRQRLRPGVTIAGGKAPYSAFSATGLPPGLTISTDGTISGTPTTAGSYTATITVTDSSTASVGGCGRCFAPGAAPPPSTGYTGTASLALTVAPPPVPTFSSPSLTYGTTLGYNRFGHRGQHRRRDPRLRHGIADRLVRRHQRYPGRRHVAQRRRRLRVETPAWCPTRPSRTIAAATASRSAPAMPAVTRIRCSSS